MEQGMEQDAALAGQVAWITGGGSGIGLAGAIELAKAGCRVVISGRDAHKLDAPLAQGEGEGAPTGVAKAGCRVVISGRDAHKLDAALAQAEVKGAPTGVISAAALDVSDAA